MIVRSSASRLDRTVRLNSTTVNFQYCISPASEARVLSGSRRVCSHSVFLEVCPFELAQQLFDACNGKGYRS